MCRANLCARNRSPEARYAGVAHSGRRCLGRRARYRLSDRFVGRVRLDRLTRQNHEQSRSAPPVHCQNWREISRNCLKSDTGSGTRRLKSADRPMGRLGHKPQYCNKLGRIGHPIDRRKTAIWTRRIAVFPVISCQKLSRVGCHAETEFVPHVHLRARDDVRRSVGKTMRRE